MPANKVHGVSIGDTFQAADWNCLEVIEFISPKSITEGWAAKVRLDNGDEATVSVTDLVHGPYRKMTP